MIRMIAFLAASTALAGSAAHEFVAPPVSSAEANAGATKAEANAAAATIIAEAAEAAAKPQFGSFGFDTAGMDKSVAPGDDFYLYANGTWAKNTPIPSDKSNYGAF